MEEATTIAEPKKKPVVTKIKDKPNRLDSRRLAFLEYYFKPDSPTFRNALQSALRAGYSKSYAENITAQEYPWLKKASESLGEIISIDTLRTKARKALDEALEGKLDVKRGSKVLKVKAASFVAGRADKDFVEKQQIDVTSAGLPLQSGLVGMLMKAYETAENTTFAPTDITKDAEILENGSTEPQ